MQKHVKFLEGRKGLVGLDKFDILVADGFVDLGDDLAQVESDIWERSLKVVLSEKFSKLSKREQESVLVHELVHARLSVYNQEAEELLKSREEFLVNELTKGFMSLLGDKK